MQEPFDKKYETVSSIKNHKRSYPYFDLFSLTDGMSTVLFPYYGLDALKAVFTKEMREKNIPLLQNDKKNNSGKTKESDVDKKPSNSTSIVNNMLSGMISGTVVAYTTFPAEGWKKWRQALLDSKKENAPAGQKVKFKPYKGSTVFAANIVPTTTIQFITNQVINSFLPQNASVWQNISASIFSGITGAVSATFVENTIARQHTLAKQGALNSGPIVAIKDMFSVSPLRPWKSFHHIAMRDGIFTFSMFWAVPEAIKWVNKNIGEGYDTVTRLGVSAVGAALSHPVDTIGTQFQKDHDKKSTFKVAKDLIAKEGAKALFRGYVPRLAMFGIFSNVLPELHKFVENNIVNTTNSATDDAPAPKPKR